MKNFQKLLSQRVFLDAYALVFYTDKCSRHALVCKTKEQAADAFETPRYERELVLVENLAEYLVDKADQGFVCLTDYHYRRDYPDYQPDNAVDFYFADESSVALSMESGAGLLPHIRQYWVFDLRDKAQPKAYQRSELKVQTVRKIVPVNN